MYVPDIGDIVWLMFDPQAGHEQKGHQPALVLSPKKYNAKTGLMLCCPLTTQIKHYPFEVLIKQGDRENVALADQIKNMDWQARKAQLKGQATTDELHQVRNKIKALLQL